MRLDSSGRAALLARARIGRVWPPHLPTLMALAGLAFNHEKSTQTCIASVAAPSEPGMSDRVSTFRRLWDRVGLTLRRTRLEYVFLVIALAWGVAQVFIVPPLQVPDEGDHWFRVWALTDGQLTADSQGVITLPGSFARIADLYTRLVGGVGGMQVLPVSLAGQAGFSSYEDLFSSSGPPGTVSVVSRVANYGPVGYLPQAIGVGLGRLVGAPPLTCFYLARLGNLFAAIVLLFFAIRLAPFGKQLYVLLALLPMTMFELASVSCDALTISGAMFFTSLLLWASTRVTLRRSDVALVVSAAAVFLNVKPGYWALVLLVLLIRPAQLGGRRRYVAFVAGNVLVVVGVFLIVFVLTAADARVQAVGGSHAQLLFILHQPLSFLGIVWSNLQGNLLMWTFQAIGILGWLTIWLPPAAYLLVLLAGAVFLIRMSDDEVRLQLWRRALLAGVSVAVFLTMAVALYAFLEPIGSGRVLFQGRYLAPVWLLLLLSAYGIRFAQRHLGQLVVVGVVLLLMALNFQTLISYYQA
ncbi:MAG: DUF2142 domain-containing protein [Candidatus Limnocylindrales bacterium]